MTIAVGLVGFGLAGRVLHTPLILDAGMEIVAVVSRQVSVVNELLPNARVFADLESMLAEAPLDLVVIATPNQLHLPQALAALQAGKHVVVDKPLAVTSADARQVIGVAQTTNRLLTTFHNRRWDSDFLTLKRLLSEARLGEVQSFEARWNRFRPQVVERWREHQDSGGGILNDLGPHLIDQALCLFGMPDWLEADVHVEREDASVDDAFEIRMGKGTVRMTLSASSMVAEPTPRFRVQGTAGSFIKYGLDVQEAQLRAGMAPDAAEFAVEPALQWGRFKDAHTGVEMQVPPHRGDWRHFYRSLSSSIQTGQPLPVEANDALTLLQLIEAARQSSQQRCRLYFSK